VLYRPPRQKVGPAAVRILRKLRIRFGETDKFPPDLQGNFFYPSFGEENQQVGPSEDSVSLSHTEWKSKLSKPLSVGRAPLTDGYISFIMPVASNIPINIGDVF
jgi:hypothetical protein